MDFKDLTETELLKKIIPSKAVEELQERYSDFQTALLNTSEEELMQFGGIGKKKAQEVMLIISLAKKLYCNLNPLKNFIYAPADVYQYYEYLKVKEVEEFHVLCLNARNRIRISSCIVKGVLNQAPITVREVFCLAVRCRAASIILVHNHPSGDPLPSKEDWEVTKCVLSGGKLLGIHVIDHIIIGKDMYYSLKEHQKDHAKEPIFS